MPHLYICKGCGFILDELQVKYTLDKPLSGTQCTKIYEPMKTPQEIIQKHNGKCPRCGRKLEFKQENSDVKVTLPSSIRKTHKRNKYHLYPTCEKCDLWRKTLDTFLQLGDRWF